MKARLITLVLPALTIFLASGCNSVRVHDLRLASIEIADPARQPVPSQLKAWDPGGRLVKFSVLTKTNVRNVAGELGLHLRSDAYFCSNQMHQLAKLQVLFDRDGAIMDNPQPSSSADGTVLWFYVAERSAARKDVKTGKLTIPPYDLLRQPRDICVQLHGRNMALEGFSSNVVIIPADEVTMALTREQ